MEKEEILTKINPMDGFKIFFRRKWLLIVPTYIGLVLGIIVCFIMPPVYQANTLIMVEEEKIINPLIQGLAVSTTAAQRMENIKEQILGWNSLSELAKKLGLDKNAQTQPQFESLIKELKDGISVDMVKGSNTIKIAYFGKNPEQARLITKTLSDILVERNLRSQTKETNLAIDFINEQLGVYKRKIKETEVADLEDQLKNLLVDSTEEHPLVRELRHKLSIAKKELETGEYKVASSDKVVDGSVYKVLQQELDKIIEGKAGVPGGQPTYTSNDNKGETVYKTVLADRLDSVAMARDKNVNENIYNMLLQKLETAKITERLEASKQGTRYSIIDPPRLPLKPASPNKPLIIFLGAFLGACVGTGMVLGKEFMDQSFLDIEDAKQNLELPVLGAISRLTTQEEIAEEKEKQKKLVKTVLSYSVALILVAILFSLIIR
jgi:polysaccharide biosynthesis transport protein